MKHIKHVTVAKAEDTSTNPISELLDQIFGFVLDILKALGKGDN